MNNILNYIQCGIIETPKLRKEVRFVVYGFNDHLEKIIPFFEKYRLLSSKYLDFLDYKKVSFLLKDKCILNKENILNIQCIKSNMNKNRIFKI